MQMDLLDLGFREIGLALLAQIADRNVRIATCGAHTTNAVGTTMIIWTKAMMRSGSAYAPLCPMSPRSVCVRVEPMQHSIDFPPRKAPCFMASLQCPNQHLVAIVWTTPATVPGSESIAACSCL